VLALPDAELVFPVMAEPQDESPAADLTGPLSEDDGCLYVGDESTTGRFLALWPHGYRAVDDSGVITIVDAAGNALLAVGDEALFGGGGISLEVANELSSEPIPDRCDTGSIWFVGDVVEP
jgi:hypothetical protein